MPAAEFESATTGSKPVMISEFHHAGMSKSALGRLRSGDLSLRRRVRYPDYATSASVNAGAGI